MSPMTFDHDDFRYDIDDDKLDAATGVADLLANHLTDEQWADLKAIAPEMAKARANRDKIREWALFLAKVGLGVLA